MVLFTFVPSTPREAINELRKQEMARNHKMEVRGRSDVLLLGESQKAS